MTDRKLLGNFIEKPNATLTIRETNWAQDISLSSLLTGNFYIVDGTVSLKTSIAEIMAMVRARDTLKSKDTKL